MVQVMANGAIEDQGDDRKGRRRPGWQKVVLGSGGVILIGCAVALALAVRAARDGAIAMASQSRLNQMQLALSNYHDMYGCFPPAYVADKDGKPMHSWRVLILPMIEQRELYDAYRFDEPWDGPNNSQLSHRMPGIFHVCSEPPSTSVTNLVVVTGDGTAFPGSRSTCVSDFADGLNNTILLAEIAESDINWLEPRDLDVERMSFRANDTSRPSISTSRRTGPHVVFADRITGYRLTASLSEAALQSLITIGGGEKMFLAEVAHQGLTSPANAPATDEEVGRLDLGGLSKLWLTRSDITDDALRHLAAAPKLTRLYLRSTRITDDGLRHLQQGPPLAVLDLSYTTVGDEGIWHLVGPARRRSSGLEIHLEGTRVTIPGVRRFLESVLDADPRAETWFHLDEGTVGRTCLFFGGSDATDAQVEYFSDLSGIRQVDLRRTRITDAGMKVMTTLPDLVSLDVSATRLTDAAIEYLGDLNRLQWLDLRETQITEDGVKKLRDCLPQCRIRWEPHSGGDDHTN
jgi:hypothetical protein